MAKTVKRLAFSDNQIKLLIDLYRENECLWNVKSPEYKSYLKRKDAIANISEKMGFTEEIIKKKIASIRSTYLLEKKKCKDSHRTGTGTDDIYHSSLPWFQYMTFLNDVIIARKTLDNFESQQIQVSCLYYLFYCDIIFLINKYYRRVH